MHPSRQSRLRLITAVNQILIGLEVKTCGSRQADVMSPVRFRCVLNAHFSRRYSMFTVNQSFHVSLCLPSTS